MSLFAVADGIKIRAVQLKRLSKKIRRGCHTLDKLKKCIHNAKEPERTRYHHEFNATAHEVSSLMKRFTDEMVEINAHLHKIKNELKP